uniref:Uncharacterized protein n=1 Tax=Anguilla anguilla TaxID=7936 RepID=A0A0E9UZU6_ANGAN
MQHISKIANSNICHSANFITFPLIIKLSKSNTSTHCKQNLNM